jgi:hypothetical protein
LLGQRPILNETEWEKRQRKNKEIGIAKLTLEDEGSVS